MPTLHKSYLILIDWSGKESPKQAQIMEHEADRHQISGLSLGKIDIAWAKQEELTFGALPRSVNALSATPSSSPAVKQSLKHSTSMTSGAPCAGKYPLTVH